MKSKVKRPVVRFPLLLLGVMVMAALFQACKTPEMVPEARLRPLSAVKLYKKALDNSFDYTTFTIKKINIEVENGESRTTFRAGIQAVKDQSVLFSVSKLNLLVARIMLTPDSVVYVNYFDKSWYAGGYEPFSRMMGISLDFQAVQAVISANIFSLFDNARALREYSTRIEEGMYVLQPEEASKLAKLEEKGKDERVERYMRRKEEPQVVQTFYFDPELIVIRKMTLEDKQTPRQAEMRFGDYELTGNKYYPGTLGLVVSVPGSRLAINARMSGFSTNDSVFVSLKIPEKYERVSLN